MTGKKITIILLCFHLSFTAFSQDSLNAIPVDTSFDETDYDELFNELDALLDSLMKPRSFTLFNLGVGNSYFNFNGKDLALKPQRKISYTPSLSYYSKSGLGIGATASIVHDGEQLNPYQFYITGSYDYLRNSRFITGIALTRFFTRDSLPFYTSPLQNELYGYFTYKKSWFKPSVAVSYGWGSRKDYEEREEYIQTLRLLLNGYTRVETEEQVNDFNLITSVRHDFYWMNVIGKKDYIRLTPQFVLTSGTQKFGFNQTSSTYATVPRTGSNVLYSTDNMYLDDQLYFQPLSLSGYVKVEYAKGKFFIQPQLVLDYYFPAEENNFMTAFVLNAGVIF